MKFKEKVIHRISLHNVQIYANPKTGELYSGMLSTGTDKHRVYINFEIDRIPLLARFIMKVGKVTEQKTPFTYLIMYSFVK